MLAIWLAWAAARGLGGVLPDAEDLKPRDNNVDALGALVMFALLLLVLLVGTVGAVLLVLGALWTSIVVTTRMVIRTTEPEGGE